jgi:hypothetical protein
MPLCCQCTHQGEIEKPSGQYLDLISNEYLTCLGLNLNPENFDGFTLLSISCGEIHLLVSWCVGDRCGMAGRDEDRGRSRRLGAEDRGWSSTGRVLGGWTIEGSDDVVCGLHRA